MNTLKAILIATLKKMYITSMIIIVYPFIILLISATIMMFLKEGNFAYTLLLSGVLVGLIFFVFAISDSRIKLGGFVEPYSFNILKFIFSIFILSQIDTGYTLQFNDFKIITEILSDIYTQVEHNTQNELLFFIVFTIVLIGVIVMVAIKQVIFWLFLGIYYWFLNLFKIFIVLL